MVGWLLFTYLMDVIVVDLFFFPNPINIKSWVGKNQTEETFELPKYVFCDDNFNFPLYEYDSGDCCQPFLMLMTCTRCNCPNLALVGDGLCNQELDRPGCDYDGARGWELACSLYPWVQRPQIWPLSPFESAVLYPTCKGVSSEASGWGWGPSERSLIVY